MPSLSCPDIYTHSHLLPSSIVWTFMYSLQS
jgi:hypothetical protein